MSDVARAVYLQEQMNNLKRTMNQLPLIVSVALSLSGGCLFAGAWFGLPWLMVSLVIWSLCTSFIVLSVRQAKRQYNYLLEQMKG
jgi:ABC-type multidrug transport system permease subunit